MAVNEVVYKGKTLISLRDDTVTPATLAEGITAHDETGALIVGTMQGSTSKDAPADVASEAQRVASSIKGKRATNAITFIAVADAHEMGDGDNASAEILERYRRANLNAGQAAKVIADRVGIDFFANLGDLAWGASTTTQRDLIASTAKARGYFAEVENSVESFIVPGNHDVSHAAGFLAADIVAGLIGSYRYVDFTDKRVRVIALNTADTSDGTTGKERVSGEQLRWFAQALDLSEKADAAKWGIIALSHHPIDWNANTQPLANCLAAYMNGTAYTATHDGVSVSYDYAGKNAATFIANFHGHTHCLKVAEISGTTAKRVAIPNACYARTNEYGEAGNTVFGEATSYEKTDNGTGKNTAFCAVSVDLTKKIIYADCYGAGYDRVISYGEAEAVTYTVTNNLTGAETNNGTKVILEDAAYSATISGLDSYRLESVSVTMGGIDITATAVSGGAVYIEKVTGDIVITATAVYVEDFDYNTAVKNSVPASLSHNLTGVYNAPYGYKNGAYASDNGDGTDAAFVATGYTPYTWSPGNAIYIKGATLDTSNSRTRIYGYTAAGVVDKSVGYASGQRIPERFSVEQLGEKYYMLTPYATNTNVKYIRISLVGTGENLIVSIGQPIHAGELEPPAVNPTVNLIEAAGYTDDFRLSSASGALKAASGMTATGFIDISGCSRPLTIRANGVDFRMNTSDGAATYRDCYIVYYTGSKAYATADALTNAKGYAANVAIAFDDAGNLTLTIPANYLPGAKYVRLCGYGRGSNLSVFAGVADVQNLQIG